MLTLYQVLLVWGKTLHFKWRERLGIEPSYRFSTGTTVLKTATGTSLAIIPKIVFSSDYSTLISWLFQHPEI